MAFTFRMEDAEASKLFRLYSKKQDGVMRAVNAFVQLHRAGTQQLKGKFSKPELTGLLDCFNGTMIDFSIGLPAKMMLQANIEDSISLDGLDVRHSFDGAALLCKIEALTEMEAVILLEEIHRFWNENGEMDGFFEKYV